MCSMFSLLVNVLKNSTQKQEGETVLPLTENKIQDHIVKNKCG